MKLNCKAGDLAVVVKSHAGNEGRIVRVIRAADVSQNVGFDGSHYWLVQGRLCDGVCSWSVAHGGDGIFEDWKLRPIRDTPGEDESLLWCPVPSERVTA